MTGNKKQRSKLSYAVEVALMSALWIINLFKIATVFRSMDLLTGFSAVAIFLFAPVEVWRAASAFREVAR